MVMGSNVIVVGGGLGGLAAALRLQHAGLQVILLEKNDQLGGKAGCLECDGYRWDTGPSLFTLPGILAELFSDTGHRMEDHLELIRLDPICRYFWRDGTIIDEDEAFFRQPEVAAFLEYASGIYDLSGEAYLHYPPEEFWRALTPDNWPMLKHLPKITTFSTLADVVDRKFSDPRLRQLFKRYATYNGSSPYLTPSTFNIIPYVEQAFGGWYPRGGIYRIVETLEKLCRESGVVIQTGCEVTSYDGDRIHYRDADGHPHSLGAPVLVWNGDTTLAYRDHLRLPGADKLARRYDRPTRSHSGYVLFLGVNHRYPQLDHHNIFFSDDYETEFTDIFDRRTPLSADPTLYVNITSRNDPDDAPPGGDNWFVLVNVPSDTEDIDWAEAGPKLEEKVIDHLEARGLDQLRSHIQVRKSISPADFSGRHLVNQGALYGWASHSIRTSVLRPPLRSPIDRNLYFVGGTTHPGGGIPLVLLSAKMVSEMVQRQEGAKVGR
jgi:phytoene desaturase